MLLPLPSPYQMLFSLLVSGVLNPHQNIHQEDKRFIFLFSFLALAGSRPGQPDGGATRRGDPRPSQGLVGKWIDPSSPRPLICAQII